VGWAEVQRPVAEAEAAIVRAAGPIAAAGGSGEALCRGGIGVVGLGVHRTGVGCSGTGRAVGEGTVCPSIGVAGSPGRGSLGPVAVAAAVAVDEADATSHRRTL
jgi:hypothetical protein